MVVGLGVLGAEFGQPLGKPGMGDNEGEEARLLLLRLGADLSGQGAQAGAWAST